MMDDAFSMHLDLLWGARFRLDRASNEYALLESLADFERANPKPTDIRDAYYTAADAFRGLPGGVVRASFERRA